MMQHMKDKPLQQKIWQAIGVFLLSVFTGLVVYQSPPESMSEFTQWIWQPAMQGVLMALGVLGINGATGANGR